MGDSIFGITECKRPEEAIDAITEGANFDAGPAPQAIADTSIFPDACRANSSDICPVIFSSPGPFIFLAVGAPIFLVVSGTDVAGLEITRATHRAAQVAAKTTGAGAANLAAGATDAAAANDGMNEAAGGEEVKDSCASTE